MEDKNQITKTSRLKKFLSAAVNFAIKYRVFTYSGLIFLGAKSYLQNEELFILRQDVTELREINADYEKMVSNLKGDLVMVNRSYEDFPLPIWHKVKRGNSYIMQHVNHAYVDMFGHIFNYDKYYYPGKTDFHIYPYHIARNYYVYDSLVAITGETLDVPEVFIDKDSTSRAIRVLKWRQVIGNDTLVYGTVIKKY